MNTNTLLMGAALIATAALLYATVTKQQAPQLPQAPPTAGGLSPSYRPAPAPTQFDNKVNSTASKLATAATTAKKLFDTGRSIFNGIKGLF